MSSPFSYAFVFRNGIVKSAPNIVKRIMMLRYSKRNNTLDAEKSRKTKELCRNRYIGKECWKKE